MSKQQAWLKREVERAAADVKKWPAWMRNETEAASKTTATRQTPTKAGEEIAGRSPSPNEWLSVAFSR